jgi:hypothetical protein
MGTASVDFPMTGPDPATIQRISRIVRHVIRVTIEF